jgi:hypothetical protein
VADNPEEESVAPVALEATSVATAPPTTGTPALAANFSLRAPHMTVLVRTDDPHVLVTQDQIDQLCKHGEDQSFNWFLALVALAVGFSQNLFTLITTLTNSKLPATWDVLAAMLCVGCAAGAFAKYTQHRTNKANMKNYVAKLKSGTPVNVT